jgi:hypothetical protein
LAPIILELIEEKMTWLRKNGFWLFALVLLGLAALLVRLARFP